MRIGPANPGYVLRAYGVRAGVGTKQAPAAVPTSAPTPASAPQAASAADRLVAGAVRGSIDFDQSAQPPPSSPALQLYTRAADKMEAATSIEIGRTIDVRG